jgi:hypothetical protein
VLRALICHPESTDLLLYASVVAEYGFSPELADTPDVGDLLTKIGTPALVVSGFPPNDPRSIQLFDVLRRFGAIGDIPTLVIVRDSVVVEAWQRARASKRIAVVSASAPIRDVRDAIASLTNRQPRAAAVAQDLGHALEPAPRPERRASTPAPERPAGHSDATWKAALEFVLRELDVPVCVLSLRDGARRRIIGAADFELQPGEDGLLESFVQLVEDANEPLIVPDAASHPLFERHPFIRAGLVRGYAGLPMTGSGEHRGAVCVFDAKPLKFGAPALERAARRVTQLGEGNGVPVRVGRLEGDDPDVLLLIDTLNTAESAPRFPLTLALVRPEWNGSSQGQSMGVRDLAVDLRDVVRENDLVVPGRQDAVFVLLSVREAAAKTALERLSTRLQQSGIIVRVASTEVPAADRLTEAVARTRRAFRPQK